MRPGGKGMGGGFGDDGSDPARLIDDESGGAARSPQGWAIGLLRRAHPYRSPVGRKQRVRMGLAHVGKRRGALVLRPAIAIAVLVGCGAAASAALGHWPALVSDAYHRLMAPPPPAASHPAEARAARPGLGRARAIDSAVSVADSVAVPAGPEPAAGGLVAEAPAVDKAPVRARAAVAVPHPARPRRLSVPTASAPARSSDDTTPVLEAMRALRVEGNPARARVLLTRYLDRYPRGTLAEEALAMSIEAAIAHGDADSGALARKYLQLYPAGHFSKLARQTLDGGAHRADN